MKPTAPLVLWFALTGLAEPLAPTLLSARARRGKEDAGRMHERMGRPTHKRPEGTLVWLHGVSVGESLSLLPLVTALRARRPHATLLVTSGTVTAADVLSRRLPEGVIHQYAPIDAPGAAARFLRHWRPSLAIFVESEIWPNLIMAARARDVRLVLLSARMTEKSAQGWSRAPKSVRALLSAFDAILPQDSATEARLRALGAETGPRLNLKLVAAPPPVEAIEAERLRAAGRRLVLGASTHPGEEATIARAWGAASAGLGARLAIAPRHPERAEAVAAELGAMGLSVARRSNGRAEGDVILIDTLGDLGAFYAAADAVVLGGAFAEGIGGHNPLEAARLSKAVITGPHAFNAREIYDGLLAEAAALEAVDEAALARHIRGLLDYPHIAQRMGAAAKAYAERQDAALDSALALLDPLLPA